MSQALQWIWKTGETRSPADQPVTPAPTSAISPPNSMPSVTGSSSGMRDEPLRMSMSTWLMPHARTRTTTSPGPATGSGASS